MSKSMIVVDQNTHRHVEPTVILQKGQKEYSRSSRIVLTTRHIQVQWQVLTVAQVCRSQSPFLSPLRAKYRQAHLRQPWSQKYHVACQFWSQRVWSKRVQGEFFGRGIHTVSGALPPTPARKRNAMSCPFVCAKPQTRFHTENSVRFVQNQGGSYAYWGRIDLTAEERENDHKFRWADQGAWEIVSCGVVNTWASQICTNGPTAVWKFQASADTSSSFTRLGLTIS